MTEATSTHTPSRRGLLAGTAALLAGGAIAHRATAATMSAPSDGALLGFCSEYHRALAAMKEFYAKMPEPSPSHPDKAAYNAWHAEDERLMNRQLDALADACDTPANTLKGIIAKARVLAAEEGFADLEAENVSQLLQDLVSLEGRA
ncbi:hypothetical protein [Acidocella sp.]|jgi:hypothetical protein|uniref:hypothetical protein n=1 Tax=Acidocella sp. TaxID=50710 RepID=UPI002F3F3F4E